MTAWQPKTAVSDRGMTYMDPITTRDDGDIVRVYESSDATSPHIWLFVKDGHIPDQRATAHMTLEEAEELARELLWFVDNHYQVAE
jgi:hypothetical protein